MGGGEAVGMSGIQIAVAAGCKVSTTCNSQSINQLLLLGAAQAVDYTTEAYMEEEERRVAEEKRRNEAQARSRWYQLVSFMITRQRLKGSYEEELIVQGNESIDKQHVGHETYDHAEMLPDLLTRSSYS